MRATILYTLFLTFFLSCNSSDHLTVQRVEPFFKLASESRDGILIKKFYKKNIKSAIKNDIPEFHKNIGIYSGTLVGKWVEAPLVRAAIFALIINKKDNNLDENSRALANIAVNSTPAKLRDPLKNILSNVNTVKTSEIYGGRVVVKWIELISDYIEEVRLEEPESAEEELLQLKFLLLTLPEDKSEVVGITKILWQQVDREVQNINFKNLKLTIEGAFPAYSH